MRHGPQVYRLAPLGRRLEPPERYPDDAPFAVVDASPTVAGVRGRHRPEATGAATTATGGEEQGCRTPARGRHGRTVRSPLRWEAVSTEPPDASRPAEVRRHPESDPQREVHQSGARETRAPAHRRRRRLVRAALALALLAVSAGESQLSWQNAGARPSIVAIIAVVCASAVAGGRGPELHPVREGVIDSSASTRWRSWRGAGLALAWPAVALAAVALDLACRLARSPAWPTLSRLIGALTARPAGRFAAVLAWMMLGAWLARAGHPSREPGRRDPSPRDLPPRDLPT